MTTKTISKAIRDIKLQELDIFLRQWTDDQVGLDVCGYSILMDGEYIRIQWKKEVIDDSIASPYHKITYADLVKHEGNKTEWRETAEALIVALAEKDFGEYQIGSVSGIHCEVEGKW